MPWEHGPKFQKNQNQEPSKRFSPDRDEYGRWIVAGGEVNDWHYKNND